MEVYTLRVELIQSIYYEDECVRVMEIPEHFTLMNLHHAIQQAVKFDDDHLYEFYAGRNPRNRAIVYGEEDNDEDYELRLSDYNSIPLNEVYPLTGMKLYYLFDFGDN